jgi:hypothetical protein
MRAARPKASNWAGTIAGKAQEALARENEPRARARVLYLAFCGERGDTEGALAAPGEARTAIRTTSTRYLLGTITRLGRSERHEKSRRFRSPAL